MTWMLFLRHVLHLVLQISLHETVVMHQTPLGQQYRHQQFQLWQENGEVDQFVYLASAVNRRCNLDNAISHQIQKASAAFGKLENRLWSQHGVHYKKKVKVYNACVLTSLLYACKTQVTYRRDLKHLERFYRRVPQKNSRNPLEAIRSEYESIEALVLKYRLRWGGHMASMGWSHGGGHMGRMTATCQSSSCMVK